MEPPVFYLTTLLITFSSQLSTEALIPGSRTAVSIWPTLDGTPTKLLGHGGEKFYLPEHTVGSYELAAIEGADYVEADLVLSADQVFVCFHDLALKRSTNVESKPEFAHLRGNHSVIVDGKNKTLVDDWLVINFTVDQLKTLKVQQQPNGVRLQYFNDLFTIATFQEFIDTTHRMSAKLNKSIGIIPELKQPQFHNFVFDETDHFMETETLRVLSTNGYPIMSEDVPQCLHNSEAVECGPLILQNFDKDSLQFLSTQVSHPSVELMMLIHPNVYLLTPLGFQEAASFAHYFCLMKDYMYTGVEAEIVFQGWEVDLDLVDSLGGFMNPEDFIPEAHRLGRRMALFTIPDSRESSGRGCAIECDPINKEEEMFYFFERGVDGMFVENIPESVAIRMKFDYELALAKPRS